MDFDWTINFSVIIAFALAAGGLVAGYAVWRYKVSAIEEDLEEFREATNIKIVAIDAAVRLQHDRAEEIRAKCAKELADFRIEVAKDYAGHVALRDMEGRMMRALEGLGVRIDKLTELRRGD